MTVRRRHIVLDSYYCVLCQQSVEETLVHLFFGCPFARDCWSLLNLTVAQGSLADILESFKLQMISPFFMNSIILMGYGQFGLLEMTSSSKGCNQVFSLVGVLSKKKFVCSSSGQSKALFTLLNHGASVYCNCSSLPYFLYFFLCFLNPSCNLQTCIPVNLFFYFNLNSL